MLFKRAYLICYLKEDFFGLLKCTVLYSTLLHAPLLSSTVLEDAGTELRTVRL
jgi:hypothetical protein